AAETDTEDEAEAETETEENKAYDFEYLYDMRMCSMLSENVAELLKKVENKKMELEELGRLTPQQLWERDLDAFLAALNKAEKKEHDKANQTPKMAKKQTKTMKGVKK